MSFYSVLGIGLSVLFGCLLLALVVELYYLLWWKKRVTNIEMHKDDNSNHRNKTLHLGCCFKMPSFSQMGPHESMRKSTDSTVQEPDLELGSAKDLLQNTMGEEGVDSELMRLHNLAGPPRFLFTIKEESKEDLESDDGKSRGGRSRKGSRTRSLGDIAFAIDTPFLSPLASSPLKAQSLDPLDSYNHHGLNPLFESSADLGLKGLKTSPPPKFKFLRDAEEKLRRRLTEEGLRKSRSAKSIQESCVKIAATSTGPAEDIDGPFLKLLVHKEKEFHHPQFPSSSSQVLTYGVLPHIVQPT